MGIVDQYIADHYNDPVDDVAAALGINSYFITRRKKILVKKFDRYVVPNPGNTKWIDNEPLALVELIKTRKSGWAVDAAKERLKKLQYLEQL